MSDIQPTEAQIKEARTIFDDTCVCDVCNHKVERIAEAIARIRADAVKAELDKDHKHPRPGDLVISASCQNVQWNGLPDPWYWNEADTIGIRGEAIVVIMRADKIKQLIEASILFEDQESADECLRTKQELGAGCHDEYGFDQEANRGR